MTQNMNKYPLTIELVPSSSWYTNVRSQVSKKVWDNIRNITYSKAGNICEICGGSGKEQGYSYSVECHEIWEYDDVNHVQKLTGMIALCPNCHKVKHAGLTITKGGKHLVLSQLQKVNNINSFEANKIINEAMVKWSYRNRFKWKVDTTYLQKHNL